MIVDLTLGLFMIRFHQVYPFIFFLFFGFFGFFYEGKMSNTLMDERYVENKLRAELTAHRVMRAIVFLTLILFGRGGVGRLLAALAGDGGP